MIERRWLVLGLVAQALVVAALGGLLVVQVLGWQAGRTEVAELRTRMLEPRYEYKVIVVSGEKLSRFGEEAMKSSAITVDDKELSKLGSQGWEVVATYLEHETAYPNFGDERYVTGLKTNVRPQRLVLVLRHRIG
jgi:hypothetical protein